MAEIPRQLLREVSPGVYSGSYTIVDDTPDGTVFVRATLSAPGLASASATSAQFTIEKRPPPTPATSPGAVRPTGTGASALPEWINWLADVIGWAVVLWGMASAALFFGILTFAVALALLALTVVFRDFLVRPVQEAVRFIFGTIVAVIADVITFIGAWLEAVAKEFQGNFVRAILRIVILAAFMWVWERAQSIPAIKQVVDLIVDTSAKIIKWVNDTIDQFQGRLNELRLDVLKVVDITRNDQSEFGKAISAFILREVNNLFGGVLGELQKLRVQLTSEFDVRLFLVRAEITVLGERMRLFPDQIRDYVAGRFRLDAEANRTALLDAADALAAEVLVSPLDRLAPAAAVRTAMAEIAAYDAGGRSEIAEAVAAVSADVAEAVATVV